jgi:hypothetical protein
MLYEKTFSVCLSVRQHDISRASLPRVTKLGMRDLWDITEGKFKEGRAITFLTFLNLKKFFNNFFFLPKLRATGYSARASLKRTVPILSYMRL